MKHKKGNLHSQANTLMECWKYHYSAHLNSTFQHEPEALNDIPHAPKIVI